VQGGIVRSGEPQRLVGALRGAACREQELDEAEIDLGGGGTVHDYHRMLHQRGGEFGMQALGATHGQRAIELDAGQAWLWVCYLVLRRGCRGARGQCSRGSTGRGMTAKA